VASSPATQEHTFGLQVLNAGDETLADLAVAFVADGSADLGFVQGASGPLPPGGARHFALPFRSIPDLRERVGAVTATDFAFVVRTGSEELWRLPGPSVRGAVAVLDEVAQGKIRES
jgi:hypothetical protein